MLKSTDEKTLKKRGITMEQIEEQLQNFKEGFPFLEIVSAASVGNGIVRTNEAENEKFLKEWDDYLEKGAEVLKFVPASGAASRMFKDLFSFADGDSEKPDTPFVEKFFDEIEKFAFYGDLDAVCLKNSGKSIDDLIAAGAYKAVVRNLLNNDGLNYGFLPKGLLKFHRYEDDVRTPMQEHLEEGALHAKSGGKVNIHFTVSGEHRALFEKHLHDTLPIFEIKHATGYRVDFSEQKPSTDTLAADTENRPFRVDGELLFRPGGHGALIANLDELDYDVIFVKNIVLVV